MVFINAQELAVKLKQWQLKDKLTAREMANKVNISVRSIYRFFNAETTYIQIGVARRLSRFVDIQWC